MVHLSLLFDVQYDQYPLRNQIWKMRAGIQLLFKKLLPFLIDAPAFVLIQNHNLSYRQVRYALFELMSGLTLKFIVTDFMESSKDCYSDVDAGSWIV
jgi:hypothetical protein